MRRLLMAGASVLALAAGDAQASTVAYTYQTIDVPGATVVTHFGLHDA
jgi:hypothetical protein